MHAVASSQTVLGPYVGRYKFGADFFTPNEGFTLSLKKDYLVMQIGDSRRPLVPLESGEFLDRNFIGRVVMQKDDAGKVIGLKIRYGTKDYLANKLGTEAVAAR